MELSIQTLQNAIDFGAKQERERAQWLEGVSGLENKIGTGQYLMPSQALKAGDFFTGADGTKISAVMPRAAKKPKVAKPAGASRKSGLSKAIKELLAERTADGFSSSYTLRDILEKTGGKEASVRMALHTMKSKGTASYDGDTKMWTGINSEGFPHGNGSEQVAA